MEEKTRKIDRRVLKTKKAIRNAFIDLLATKDYNQITVKDIADAADCDRKTVYNYYNGIYEIREELENELVALIDNAVKKLDFKKNLENPQHIFDTLTEILAVDLDLYKNLMKIDAKSMIIRKIVSMMSDKVREGLEMTSPDISPEKAGVFATFITSGMLSVYQQWFNAEYSMPLSELSADLGKMILYGVQSFLPEN